MVTHEEALRRLVGVLTINHGRSQDMNASIPYTSCPCCGIMNLYEHVPDVPANHQEDCALVHARKSLGIAGY